MVAALFTSHGAPAPAGAVQRTAKGRPFVRVELPCGRCGGAGRSDRWQHTGYTCFQCGGNGRGVTKAVKLYTPAEVEKLSARRAKAIAKATAKAEAAAVVQAAKEDRQAADVRAAYADLFAGVATYLPDSEFAADILAKALKFGSLTDGQAGALKTAIDRAKAKADRPSRHVGEIGKRQVFTATVQHVATFESSFNGYDRTVHIHIMEDADGNVIVHKGQSIASKGEMITFAATVKEHGQRDGVLQTIVQRPKVQS